MRQLPRLQLVFAGQPPGFPADRAREHGARIARGGRGAREKEERADPHRAGARARRLPRGRNASGWSARPPRLPRRSDERKYAKRVAEEPGRTSAGHGVSSRRYAARAPARDRPKPLPPAHVAASGAPAGFALAYGAGRRAPGSRPGRRRRSAACRAEGRGNGSRPPGFHRGPAESPFRSDRSRRVRRARSVVGPGWMVAALELRSPPRPRRRSSAVQPGSGSGDRSYGRPLRRRGTRRLSSAARCCPGARPAPAQRETVRCRSAPRISHADLSMHAISPQSAAFPGLVDSHCHLDFPDFDGKMAEIREEMRANGVTHALCITVNLAGFPKVLGLAEAHDNFLATVGVHPDHEDRTAVDRARLVELAHHPRVVAIGETGLDYYRVSGDLEWQRERFRAHMRAARECGKPLVIHTRQGAEDTLTIMREEGAGEVGGVMHCFTESQAVADAAMALGFHISFSGIVTFKNAGALKDVARQVPLERLLVETDSPYLAPVPHRGKINRPALVRHVPEELPRLPRISLTQLPPPTTGT